MSVTSNPTLTRHGAHRSGRGRSVLTALMPSLLAVAAVAALITSLAVWQGKEPSQPSAAAGETTDSRDGSAAATAPPPTPATPATAAPTASSPTGTPSATAVTSAAVAKDTEVVVLNQTTRAGLAASVADRLRDAGWTVPVVGNFRGVVPATTVYYPDGARAQAQAAAADLPVPPRVLPRFGNLSTTRLTVVVTDSYPS